MKALEKNTVKFVKLIKESSLDKTLMCFVHIGANQTLMLKHTEVH